MWKYGDSWSLRDGLAGSDLGELFDLVTDHTDSTFIRCIQFKYSLLIKLWPILRTEK